MHDNISRCVDTVIAATEFVGLEISAFNTAKGNVIIPGNFDFSDTEVEEELWGYEVSPTGVCNPFGENHSMEIMFSEDQTPEKVAALLVASLVSCIPLEMPVCPKCAQEVSA